MTSILKFKTSSGGAVSLHPEDTAALVTQILPAASGEVLLDTTAAADVIEYTPAGTSAVPTTVQTKLRESVSVFDFMSPAEIAAVHTNTWTTVSDVTTAVQAAIDSASDAGGGVIVFPTGTYLVSGIVLKSSVALIGKGVNTIIKLKNAANSHVLYGGNVTDIVLRDFTVDGNKSNQSIGSGNNWRGVYFLGRCHRIRADNVWIKNSTDHGFFLSDGGGTSNACGKDSLMTKIFVTGSGSQAHLDAGGAGGSGMVGGCISASWIGCSATGNWLNGFKSSGVHVSCDSYENNSGFETGFSTPEYTQTKYIGCRAFNNAGDGWRNQGQGDELTWIGCTAEQNDGAGITILNAVESASIIGCWLKNNGQDTTTAYSSIAGFSGLFVSLTSAAPSNITVQGTHFIDDQVTKTQRHHVYVADTVNGLKVADDCHFTEAASQKIYVASAAISADIEIGSCYGLDTVQNTAVPVALTGTTAEQTLGTITIPAYSIGVKQQIKVLARGNVTGTTGTKTIRLMVGAASVICSSQTAAEQQLWAIEATVIREAGPAVFVAIRCYEATGSSTLQTFAVNVSTTLALTISVKASLGSASDTITQTLFRVRSE